MSYIKTNKLFFNNETLAPIVLNEQDWRITFVGNWTLENHPAYVGQYGKYIQNSNHDGYLQIKVPLGYTRARFEGIVGQPGSTNYGQYDYLVNDVFIGTGSFTRDIPNQFGFGVYFDIPVQYNDIIKQVFYGGTGFSDSIVFYN